MSDGDPASTEWTPADCTPANWDGNLDSLNRWKQGDVVLDVPFSWIMPPGEDPITNAFNPQKEPAAFRSATAPTVSVVLCSQTCDIGAGGPGSVHPFVLGAPLVPGRTLDVSTRRLAKQWRTGYLLPAAPDPTFVRPEAEGWFVDLRLIIPISKGLLLVRNPVAGFIETAGPPGVGDRRQSDAGLLSWFGESVGFKFRRPALHSALSETLPKIIDEYIANQPGAQAFKNTDQVRLEVMDGTRLDPKAIRVHVLGFGPFSGNDEQMWRGWEKRGKPAMKDAGFTVQPTVFDYAASFHFDKVRRTTPMVLKHIDSRGGG